MLITNKLLNLVDIFPGLLIFEVVVTCFVHVLQIVVANFLEDLLLFTQLMNEIKEKLIY